MRLVGPLVASVLAGCASFTPADAGSVDAGEVDRPDGGDGGTEAGADGSRCGAMRCIDFEPADQRVPPFGFDKLITEQDGGLSLGVGFESSTALVARSVGDARSLGTISFPAAPATVHVRLRVRSIAMIKNDSASAHFLVLTCVEGETLNAKLTFDGYLSAQVVDRGQSVTPYVDGEWIPVDAVASFGPAEHSLKVTRVDNGAAKVVLSPTACTGRLEVRLGASVQGGSSGDSTLSIDDIAIDWN